MFQELNLILLIDEFRNTIPAVHSEEKFSVINAG